MVVNIHYQEDDKPKIYTISAITKHDFEVCLKRFKDSTGLEDNQFSMEIISGSTL